jgi:hypothetical protein
MPRTSVRAEVAELVVETTMVPGKGWRLIEVYTDREGLEIDRSLAIGDYFPTPEMARYWVEANPAYRYLRKERGISVRFVAKPPRAPD